MDNLIKIAQDSMWVKPDVPSFKSGDTITVTYRIVEGSKERLQSFRGTVIQIKGSGITKMFTIRKISDGIGVERIFPLYSPHIDHIEVNKVGVVRRARIYYLRGLTGKKARIKERRECFRNSLRDCTVFGAGGRTTACLRFAPIWQSARFLFFLYVGSAGDRTAPCAS